MAKKRVTQSWCLPRTPEYAAWADMLSRCRNPKLKNYPRYGGRGITVSERWHTFANFIADMGPRPSREHSLDRKDNDGPYSPENCRWATRIEQNRNKRGIRPLTAFGETRLVQDWARLYAMNPMTLKVRLDAGWAPERALTQHVQHRTWRFQPRTWRDGQGWKTRPS